jgi:hypothetical protein
MFARSQKSSSPTSQHHAISGPRVGDRMADRMGRQWQVSKTTLFGVQVRDIAGGLAGASFLLTRGELHKLCGAESALTDSQDRW